jgi:N-acetyl-gamma-glutamyl-phosphate reductase
MGVNLFIDGAAGTTGLEIRERIADRRDIDLLTLDEARRKDPAARAEALNRADVVILCLPDDAAREAVSLIESNSVKVIDASTAHRVASGWTYGFAELEAGRRAELATATRVSNPGCYPTGFLALVRPLVREGLLPASLPVSVDAASGYSGGGKSMIASFEDPAAPDATETAYRAYGLGLAHKHVPEMHAHSGLDRAPVFTPSVVRTYRGMIVGISLSLDSLTGAPDATQLRQLLADSYPGSSIVRVIDGATTAGLTSLDIERCAGTDRMELFVFANERTRQVRLIAALDNLGKGAGGAAVQNLNLMAGMDETTGLIL